MTDYNSNLIGVLEIGIFFSIPLHGTSVFQAYVYFCSYSKDPLWMKLAIASVWLSSFAQLVAVCIGLYTMTVIKYGFPPALVRLPIALPVSAGFGQYVHSVTQAIYAYWIYRLSGRLPVPIFCCIVSIYDLAGALMFAIVVPPVVLRAQLEYLNRWAWILHSIFSSMAFLDAIVAVCLCYYLRKHRKIVVQRTESFVDKIIIWTIQSGVVTFFTALALTIVFAVDKEGMAWLGLYIFLTSMCPTALFVLLNGQENLQTVLANTPRRSRSTASNLHHMHLVRTTSRMSALVFNADSAVLNGSEMQLAPL